MMGIPKSFNFPFFDILFFFFQTTPPSGGLEFFTCNFEQDACTNALESVQPVAGGPEFEWTRFRGKIVLSFCFTLSISLTVNVTQN